MTLCENAAGALYIVNKMCVDGQRKCARVKQVNGNVHSNSSGRGMSSVLDETSIRTSGPGLTQANGSRSLVRPLGRHGHRRSSPDTKLYSLISICIRE